jgi:DNA-directed RNA polymerase subunit RPC12/RpoP
MAVYEVLTVILIAVLALGATLAIYIGVIGMLGGFYFVRCADCGHLSLSATKWPRNACAHCRHPVLMHPLHAVHHPRQVRDIRRVHYRQSNP